MRDAKAQVFADMQPLDPERVVFGQFEGYREEEDVEDDSEVETFVAIEAFIDNDRWQGVPFYLRTGKALAQGRRTITLRFRTAQSLIFGEDPGPNELVLELTDDPQVTIHMRAKRPGPDMELADARMCMDFSNAIPGADPLEAYERLLLEVIRGEQTLFTRSDEVDRLWQVVSPVLDDPPAIESYEKGSWGPRSGPGPARGRLAAGARGCLSSREPPRSGSTSRSPTTA